MSPTTYRWQYSIKIS
ncbi:hypothetical protein R3I94_006921 [Phoxinus phoxinus]